MKYILVNWMQIIFVKRNFNKQKHLTWCAKCGKTHPEKEYSAFGKIFFNFDENNHFAKFK